VEGWRLDRRLEEENQGGHGPTGQMATEKDSSSNILQIFMCDTLTEF